MKGELLAQDQLKQSNKGLKQASFGKATVIMAVATIVSRVTGYMRILVFAAAFGATSTVVFRGVQARVNDSFNLANVMPNMIYELILGGVLSSLFIPIFVEYLTKESEEEAWKVASIVTNIALIITAVVTVLGIVFAYWLVKLQALTVSAEELVLPVFFFKFFIVQIIFYALCAIFFGLLNSYRHFTAPAVAPIFNNVVVILTLLFWYIPMASKNIELALTGLAIGTTLGVVSMALVQVPALIKLGIRYRPIVDWKHPAVRKIVMLAGPVIGYVIAHQVGYTFGVNNLAYPLKGGVTAYQYSWYFFTLPYGVFAVSIITALFPVLSEKISRGDITGFKQQFSLGVRTTSFVILPMAVYLFVMSEPIIGFFLQYKKFSQADVDLTAPVLSFFAIGLLSFSIYMLLQKTYYSMQDTLTPFKISLIAVPFNIFVNIYFVGIMGVKGLALGHALTYTLASFLIIYLLRRRVGALGGWHILKTLFKFSLSAIVMGVAVYYLARLVMIFSLTLFILRIVQLGSTLIAATAVYFAANYLLKVEELDQFLSLIWGFIRGGSNEAKLSP